MDRRTLLATMGAAALAPLGLGKLARAAGLGGLVTLTERPPNLEMAPSGFDSDLTPNDGFFVRWHLGLPERADPATFRLALAGHVEKAVELSLAELEKLEPVELVAVNQCAGNGRRSFEPRVPGGQWSTGAIGNAKWRGVPLSKLLASAGIKAGAKTVVFHGLDAPPAPKTPDFAKSLAVDHANDGQVMVAYRMNGEALPLANGYPLRLVVPGWYGTYWVKALSKIEVLDGEFDGYWMAKAYRVPKNRERAATRSRRRPSPSAACSCGAS